MVRSAHALQPDAQLEARTDGPRLRLYSVDVSLPLSLSLSPSQYSPYEVGMRVGGKSSAGKNMSMKSGTGSHERERRTNGELQAGAVGLRDNRFDFSPLHSSWTFQIESSESRMGPLSMISFHISRVLVPSNPSINACSEMLGSLLKSIRAYTTRQHCYTTLRRHL